VQISALIKRHLFATNMRLLNTNEKKTITRACPQAQSDIKPIHCELLHLSANNLLCVSKRNCNLLSHKYRITAETVYFEDRKNLLNLNK